MKPLGMSKYRLAKEINVPRTAYWRDYRRAPRHHGGHRSAPVPVLRPLGRLVAALAGRLRHADDARPARRGLAKMKPWPALPQRAMARPPKAGGSSLRKGLPSSFTKSGAAKSRGPSCHRTRPRRRFVVHPLGSRHMPNHEIDDLESLASNDAPLHTAYSGTRSESVVAARSIIRVSATPSSCTTTRRSDIALVRRSSHRATTGLSPRSAILWSAVADR